MVNEIKSFFMKFMFRLKPEGKPATDLFEALSNLSHGKARVVIDVGSHHGNYARRLDSYITIENYFCFEPFAPSFQLLRQNLNSDRFQLFPIALSDHTGVSDFYSNNFEETNSLLPSGKTNSPIDTLTTTNRVVKVNVDTLDRFCSNHKIGQIDILKIDAQGTTFNVLYGARQLLENSAIALIQCEVEFIEIYKNEKLFHKIATLLEEYGYKLYSLYNLHFDIDKRLSWADAIFTRYDKTTDQ